MRYLEPIPRNTHAVDCGSAVARLVPPCGIRWLTEHDTPARGRTRNRAEGRGEGSRGDLEATRPPVGDSGRRQPAPAPRTGTGEPVSALASRGRRLTRTQLSGEGARQRADRCAGAERLGAAAVAVLANRGVARQAREAASQGQRASRELLSTAWADTMSSSEAGRLGEFAGCGPGWNSDVAEAVDEPHDRGSGFRFTEWRIL